MPDAPGCFARFLPTSRLPKSRKLKSKTTSSTPTSDPTVGQPSNGKDSDILSSSRPFDLTHFATCCDFSACSGDPTNPPPYAASLEGIYRPEVLDTIEAELNELDSELRKLSLQIHDHPELGFNEHYAHDTLTAFMESHGFAVSRHFSDLDTAWRAEFAHGKGGRTLGVNAEMDALPGIGHACGHNLIAVAGVGVALAVRAALVKHAVAGRVVLLGTPAEEGGGGKAILVDHGAYDDMDVCVMCHPAPGPSQAFQVGSGLAMQSLEVEYFGRTAHASAAPWQGVNSLDAAFLAYSSISVLRQQILPTHRVHGTVFGRDWAANVIPDYARMKWITRAPTWAEVDVLRERVVNCLKAAALATGCEYKLVQTSAYYDVRQNRPLAETLAATSRERYGIPTTFIDPSQMSASTDFGNVSYVVPAFHPNFHIPAPEGSGNHTVGFADASATPAAHAAMLAMSKALAHASFRALDDAVFFASVRDSFEKEKRSKEGRWGGSRSSFEGGLILVWKRVPSSGDALAWLVPG
ncbi:hypothetical protein OF83DRAFT_389613 [Amylostereum chailletii]|nr:hypothetical protein OF83DRAFT_389613 [Amylostereum chailletii]